MSPRSIFTVLALRSASALMVGCTDAEVLDATQVIVHLDADDQLKAELARIEVEVLDESGQTRASQQDFDLTRNQDSALPLSFGVYQPQGGADWFMLKTRGFDARGEPLVEHRALDHFEKHRVTRLQIQLGGLCRLNFCDGQPDQTCSWRTGQCEVVRREPDAGAGEGSDAGPPLDIDRGADAGASVTRPAPASITGFCTLGGRRTDGVIAVFNDGFERGARVCSADGKFCALGEFSP